MIRSQINMTRPSVMSRYLLITAAMMSVPPVLPLLEKAMPMPLPQKEAPMTQAMKGWSCRRTTPSVSFWIMERKKVRVNTAKIVFTLNFHPNTRRASNRSRKLMAKYVYWTGNPVAKYTMDAMPGTPPVVISLGSRKTVQPIPYKTIPRAIIR